MGVALAEGIPWFWYCAFKAFAQCFPSLGAGWWLLLCVGVVLLGCLVDDIVVSVQVVVHEISPSELLLRMWRGWDCYLAF